MCIIHCYTIKTLYIYKIKIKNIYFRPKRYKLNELVKWMFDIKFKYFENNIKIVDMKYDPYAWLKTSLREYIYTIHPTTDMLWEILECVSVLKVFN